MNHTLHSTITGAFLALGLTTSHGATVAQASGNDNWPSAQVLNGALSQGFDPAIAGSSGVMAEHATVLGLGNGSYHWYQVSHIGGDFFMDIENSTLSGAGPTDPIGVGVYYSPDGGSSFQLVTAYTNGVNSSADLGSTNQDPFIFIPGAPATNFWIGVGSADTVFNPLFMGISSGTPLAVDSAYNLTTTIPEPSAALLGSLGMLFLLRRKR